jgi:DNA-binding transcriptional LysR family regulator
MDVRFIETFVAVADCGSISSAARRTGLTPAALAQRLHKLEQELGHPLVERVGRTVRLTASGLAILDHARNLIDDAHNLKAIASNDKPVGQLRLGATATAITGLVPRVIARLGLTYPLIEYFIRPGSSADLYHAVVIGDLDAAIIVKPHFQVPKSIGWLRLRREPFVLIAPEEMALEETHRAITSHPFIRYDRNQWGGQIVDRYLRRHGLKVRERLELDALDAIAALVDRGLGVAIVPDWAPPWPEGLKLHKHPLLGCEARKVGAVWGKSGARIAATRAFIKICGDVAADFDDPIRQES